MAHLNHKELGRLLESARGGDETAFNQIYHATADIQSYMIQNYTDSQQDREDILQTVYLVLWEKLPLIKNPRALVSYLNSITLHTCLHHKRTLIRKPSEPLNEELIAAIPDTGQNSDIHESLLDLRKAMEKLEPRERTILIMRYVQKCKLDEIADVLDISISTVKRDLHTAVGKLRSQMNMIFPFTAMAFKKAEKANGQNSGPPNYLLKVVIFVLIVLGSVFLTARAVEKPSIKIKINNTARNTVLPLHAQVECAFTIRKLTLTAPNGDTFELEKTGRNTFTGTLYDNGSYILTAYANNLSTATKNLKITCIDRSTPILTNTYIKGGEVVLKAEDSISGLNSVQVYDSAGCPMTPVSYEADGALTSYQLGPGRYKCILNDKAGNETEEYFTIEETP